MREKAIASLRTAPRRGRDVLDAELARLLGEGRTQIEPNRSSAAEARGDFRTYFITLATNAYATMHYDIARSGMSMGRQLLDGPRQHPAGRAAPARVQ
jgi:hypothetical protein